ncbi:unnamed protein product [Rhizopus stolonifer]
MAVSHVLWPDDPPSSTPEAENTAPPPPVKYRKRHLFFALVREIKRLRAENATLNTTVDILRDDIKHIKESRAETDATHKRAYNESLDKNDQLEVDLMDRDDEIKELKKKIEDLQSQLNSGTLQRSGPDEDDYAQPKTLAELFDQYYEECEIEGNKEFKSNIDNDTKDGNTKNGEIKDTTLCIDNDDKAGIKSEDDFDEDEEEDLGFEKLGDICVKQAILSKLSSARARLELDDLVIKYDAQDEVVSAVLGRAFIQWISGFFDFGGFTPGTFNSYMAEAEADIAKFWVNFLQHYLETEENQVLFLKSIELTVLEADKIQFPGLMTSNYERLMFTVYKHDIVTGDAVIEWWSNSGSKVRGVTRKFAEWLDDDDEDEGDEEEEEVEEDETTVQRMIQLNNACLDSSCRCDGVVTAPSSDIVKIKKNVHITI